jgi:hypothetical protein
MGQRCEANAFVSRTQTALGRSAGTRYIFANRAKASSRRVPVNSTLCEYTMNGAYSEVEGWVVDVDDNTTDGRLIVTIRNPRVYKDFWCDCCEAFRKAAHFLNVPSVDSSLRIGAFCATLLSNSISSNKNRMSFTCPLHGKMNNLWHIVSPQMIADSSRTL